MSIKYHNPALILLERFKGKFDPVLEAYLKAEIRQAKRVDKRSAELLEEILKFIKNGGKRFRPAAMYYTYRALGGENKKKMLKACMSIELLHNFALIHDDIIDKSEVRRGAPTLHKSLEEKYKKKNFKDYGHLAVSSALLAGDLTMNLAEKAINKSSFPQDRIKKAQEILCFTKDRTILGQHLDLMASAEKDIPREKVIEGILENKTAIYTFECPISIGAALAGAKDSEIEILRKVGNLLGRVFQIQDDILGIFGNEEILGKSVTSDLSEGKKTLLISKAFQFANRNQRKILTKILGSKRITIEMLKKVRKIISDTGSLEYSHKLAESYIKRAEELIRSSPLSDEGEEFLSGIAQYLLVRTY